MSAMPRDPEDVLVTLSDRVAIHVAEGWDTADSADPPRCERRARKGTGEGTCGRPLDTQGRCDRASAHLD